MDSLEFHEKYKGKLSIISKVSLKNREDLSLAYTPGVAEPCKEIYKKVNDVYKYTIKGNTVGVVSDGSAVLGLGNIGAEAALPVMEGKCVLFKEFANIDAFPICIKSQNTEEIISIVKNISPVFGGINLEDISSPRCFEIEERLKKELDIPVMHDDQHGTAIVVLAGLINAVKVVKKEFRNLKIVVNGAGAAGTAVSKLLLKEGAGDIILVDREGILNKNNKNLMQYKKEMAKITNKESIEGGLRDALENSDVFIGLSAPNILKAGDIKLMNRNAIIFAMANPVPEIMPDEAKKGGAKIVATGRSDFPNQINNVLAFPGVFRGALDHNVRKITDEMKLNAAHTLADVVKDVKEDNIIPDVFDKNVVKVVANSIK
ncbi:NADP-dependent malic enzyme [Candidatus Woesearchaeota archaeon]|nr:NADP-dependent malic enzyme [Candidatus Woesearchaeota archaeon]